MRITHFVFRTFLCVLALVSALFPALAQGRPDLVWMRGRHISTVGTVAYSPDGKWVVSLAETGKIWRISDGMLMRTLPSGFNARFTQDSSALLIAGGNTVSVYRIPDGSLLRAITI